MRLLEVGDQDKGTRGVSPGGKRQSFSGRRVPYICRYCVRANTCDLHSEATRKHSKE